jgi:hypothetical protein
MQTVWLTADELAAVFKIKNQPCACGLGKGCLACDVAGWCALTHKQ